MPAEKRPRKIFADTVFLIALVNEGDQWHEQATEALNRSVGISLLITDAVLLEVGNALSRGFKSEAVELIENLLSADEVEVIHLTPELFERAFALYRAFRDKEWGLVDCFSFIVMRDEGITEALTFDRHFVQAGFNALMRENR